MTMSILVEEEKPAGNVARHSAEANSLKLLLSVPKKIWNKNKKA